MFQRIQKQNPESMKKVIPLSGDVGMKNLGLTNEQLEILINETDVVFHFAATLKLESKLKDAIDMNTVNLLIKSRNKHFVVSNVQIQLYVSILIFVLFFLNFLFVILLILSFKVGTKRVIELGRKMKKLKAFVHLSTAFCYADKEELDEKVYESSADPHDVMRLVQWLDESAIDLITPK